jgi:Rps23 Pro-64 3,4-dihydroxylase Tpa1-like proline 4-hydroxylase
MHDAMLARVAVAPGFLPAAEHMRVQRFAGEHVDALQAAVIRDRGDWREDQTRRRSRSIAADALRPIFEAPLERAVPAVCARLELEPFDVQDIELQLTVSGDGDFYKVHSDNVRDAAGMVLGSRLLTFVYYFFREPKPFTGGELRLYDTVYQNGKIVRTGEHIDVEPAQNTLVVFDSSLAHEVREVRARDSAQEPLGTAGGRWTVNGWLHGIRFKTGKP